MVALSLCILIVSYYSYKKNDPYVPNTESLFPTEKTVIEGSGH